MFAVLGVIALFVAFVERSLRSARLRSQNQLQDLHDLSWKQFEQVVADAYRSMGYRVQEVGGQSDGGIDLILRDANNVPIAVQCKRWRKWRVGSPMIREFVGAMVGCPGVQKGIYVTCGAYTPAAVTLAKRRGIELVDGRRLLDIIGAANGRFPIPPPAPVQTVTPNPSVLGAPMQMLACPKCGSVMVRRTASRGPYVGQDFWGCSSWPRCHGRRKM
jgi:restriction system protein